MKRLELLDYARFFAAIAVVAYHYTFNGIVNGKIDSISHIPSVIELTKYGYLGVELFFMISGYVIFFSATNRTASRFAISRAVRLYPTYWFAVMFTSLFAFQWGGELMSVTFSQVLVNFTMIHALFGVDSVDGVYWTLAYEIQFYFVIFALIYLGFQKHLNALFMLWPVLFCVAFLTGLDGLPYLGGYFYYFSAGVLFAILSNQADKRAILGLVVVYLFCLDYTTGKATGLTQSKGVEHSAYIIGLLVTSFFVLFAYQNSKRGQSLRLPMSRLAGGLTYPIYLIHAHFGYMFLSQYANEDNKITLYLITLSIVFSVALLMHYVIEKYFDSLWRKLFNVIIGHPIILAQTGLKKLKPSYGNR